MISLLQKLFKNVFSAVRRSSDDNDELEHPSQKSVCTIVSDGGASRTATAAACIITIPEKKRKLKVVFLGAACRCDEAEWLGGILGLCAAREIAPDIRHVNWLGDSKTVLDVAERLASPAMKDSIPNTPLKKAFRLLALSVSLTCTHIRGHAGHVRNEACDRACRWVLKKGETLLALYGEGPIGTVRNHDPKEAWILLDARTTVEDLLTANNEEDLIDTIARFRQHVHRVVLRPHVARVNQ